VPELPDLVHVERVLAGALAGERIAAARTGDPTVLRVMIPEPFPATLDGRTLAEVRRRGHFMRFALSGDVVLVINAMLVGKYRLLEAGDAAREKDPVALGLALTFEGGRELRYIDDKRMGKVYVARAADEGAIPVYGALGIEVLSPELDGERFRALARGRRDQVRSFLMDKRTLASIGNAYADEILFHARIHPKTLVSKLGPEELGRLHLSLREVLARAIDEIEKRNMPVEVKVRDFLAVRGRDGKPCPVCGTTIRAVRVGDGDACFCPSCQPATRRLFVDWGRLNPGAAATGGAAAPTPAAGDRGRSRPRSRR
jgi:formamidopyrimidine-DNA glycosylase